jgi:hypothetical protein
MGNAISRYRFNRRIKKDDTKCVLGVESQFNSDSKFAPEINHEIEDKIKEVHPCLLLGPQYNIPLIPIYYTYISNVVSITSNPKFNQLWNIAYDMSDIDKRLICIDSSNDTVLRHSVKQHRVQLTGGNENMVATIVGIWQFIGDAVKGHDEYTFIHCSDGKRKSPAIVAGYIALSSGKSYDEVFESIMSQYPLAEKDETMRSIVLDAMSRIEISATQHDDIQSL